LAPFSLGTDTGGSVRIPSAFCGTVGLRPTTGKLSQLGVVPIAEFSDTIGPMARTVENVEYIYRALQGCLPTSEPVDLKGKRIGVPRGFLYENMEPDVAVLVEKALGILRESGLVI
jgi:indoleacetamide hydrolase